PAPRDGGGRPAHGGSGASRAEGAWARPARPGAGPGRAACWSTDRSLATRRARRAAGRVGLTVVDAGTIIGVLDAAGPHHDAAVRALSVVVSAGDAIAVPASAYAEALVAPAR